MPTTNPVIIVHGIQGSWLKDEYPVDYQRSILWTGILHKKTGSMHLHSMDPSVDAEAKRLVMPHQAVPLIYEALVEEIRDELEETHPYVYVFTYDWRKDNRLAAAELGRFVERMLHIAGVHERGKLLHGLIDRHTGLDHKHCNTRFLQRINKLCQTSTAND